jgi:hypothetical protein
VATEYIGRFPFTNHHHQIHHHITFACARSTQKKERSTSSKFIYASAEAVHRSVDAGE